MKRIVLLRHGQSTWNKENRFTGWTDVDLTEKGVAEADRAGELLKKEGFAFDKAYTSYLKRAVKTLDRVLDKLDQDYVYRLVRHAIDAFFRRNVLQYDYEGKTVCFVGSNACAYSGVLTEVADSYNIKIKKIAPSSMPGLVKYHSTDR